MDFILSRFRFQHKLLSILFIVTASNYFIVSLLFQADNHILFKIAPVKPSELDSNEFESSLFLKEMREFPWDSFLNKLERFNSSQNELIAFLELQRYSTFLLLTLHKFIVEPPRVPQNKSCKSYNCETKLVQSIISSNHCIPLNRPRKVGILLQFGFDVDTLEIHLNELNAYVDNFFIIESIKPHSRFLSGKYLLWDTLKFQERFMKFHDKVIHFIVDDADLATSLHENSTNIWERESTQEELRWVKFLEWNRRTNYFLSDDILGFGDVDEIPAVDNIIYLKHCALPQNITSVDIGIWFPFDGLDSVFVPDYPVPGHPFTLGDPTFWSVASALKFYNKTANKFPSRLRGKSPAFLLGGSHLSRYAYPPYQMTKMLTATETSLEVIKRVIDIGMLYQSGNIKEASDMLNYLPGSLSNRTGSMKHFRSSIYGAKEYENIVKVPNFLSCNSKRYPGFWKQNDTRLYEKW